MGILQRWADDGAAFLAGMDSIGIVGGGGGSTPRNHECLSGKEMPLLSPLSRPGLKLARGAWDALRRPSRAHCGRCGGRRAVAAQ
jgi:hypothetical protein